MGTGLAKADGVACARRLGRNGFLTTYDSSTLGHRFRLNRPGDCPRMAHGDGLSGHLAVGHALQCKG